MTTYGKETIYDLAITEYQDRTASSRVQPPKQQAYARTGALFCTCKQHYDNENYETDKGLHQETDALVLPH